MLNICTLQVIPFLRVISALFFLFMILLIKDNYAEIYVLPPSTPIFGCGKDKKGGVCTSSPPTPPDPLYSPFWEDLVPLAPKNLEPNSILLENESISS